MLIGGLFVGCASRVGKPVADADGLMVDGFVIGAEHLGQPLPSIQERPVEQREQELRRDAVGQVRYGLPRGFYDVDPTLEATREEIGLPDATDELWVISRSISDSAPATARNNDDQPGSGAMVFQREGEAEVVPLPLKHTDVRAKISGYVASVDVRQRFHNPFTGKIEAKYVFPLPQDAAVNDFVMTIGDRRIRGVIREREEAEKVYAAARAQGYTASLLTQERPNIFTQSVANIAPGKSIDVTITYFHALPHRDGWYEFKFPMVIGPRFNQPGGGDGIGSVFHSGEQTAPVSNQATTVAYLRPEQRSGHDIGLSLEVDAGVAIEAFECPSHIVQTARDDSGTLQVSLGDHDRIPNKDFVFRFRPAGDALKSALLTHRGDNGGFFTLMIHPPADLENLRQHPLELVFVLDCSGSMDGEPIAQAKAAVRRAVQQLRPQDAFQVIRFSNNASQLGDRPLPATAQNIRRGLNYVDALEGAGGTMMIEGIKAALDFPHDPERLRFVVFLTDGYIGNESEIFATVGERLGASRIFSFGVGSSPNRYLLEGLARLGNGAVAWLNPGDDAVGVMDDIVARIARPALTDVEIDWGALRPTDMYPRRLGDVFVGRPLVVIGRFDGDPSDITITGRAATERVRQTVMVSRSAAEEDHSVLASLWARKRIQSLSDRMNFTTDPTLPTLIRETALQHQLMSAYTAFVAVDSLDRTEGASTTVQQPVPVPAGVNARTAVGE